MGAAPLPSPTATWHDNTYPSLSPSRPELSAKGKNVVVTGGGTGIGAETARHFAAAGAARIALFGRREQPLLDTKASIEKEYPGVEVFTASTDVSKKDEVDAAFKKFAGNEKINVLISNAAMAGPMEAVEFADGEKFMDSIDMNIRAAMNVAKAFLPLAASDAVVVDVSSAAAHVNVDAFAAYCVSKLAVVKLWDTVGFANKELSVFHTQPGVVDTDMNKAAGGVAAIGFEDHVSLPASFHLWLASPEAHFLKGKFLWANWDVDELKAQAEEIKATGKFDVQVVGWPFGTGGYDFQMKEDSKP